MSSVPENILELVFIDDEKSLAQACEQLGHQPYLAVDTEFVREKTYYPILCLIQIASPKHCFCIDPITIRDLSPLSTLLLDTQTTKVFHAARQDLEILYQTLGAIPSPVFDTQVAATLLGLGDQISYANLVRHFTQKQLAKGQARTDWQRRPLSHEQLEYAADDVRYLVNLYPVLRETLENLGRLAWLEDDFNRLCQPELYENDPGQQWQRVSGLQKLRGVKLAVLQQLATWREQLAQQQDKPRKWIMPDDSLLTLAMQSPQRMDQLERIRGINAGILQRHGATLLELIRRAEKTPKDEWPVLTRRKTLEAGQEAVLDALLAIVKLQAAAQQINQSALTSRQDLESLVTGNRDIALLQGWRRGIAGEQVLEFLHGQTCLAMSEQGELITRVND